MYRACDPGDALLRDDKDGTGRLEYDLLRRTSCRAYFGPPMYSTTTPGLFNRATSIADSETSTPSVPSEENRNLIRFSTSDGICVKVTICASPRREGYV